jgi:hypothetical protein
MHRTELLLGIVALLALEVNHLKWIVWEHWQCRRCGLAHKRCGCSSKRWLLWL